MTIFPRVVGVHICISDVWKLFRTANNLFDKSITLFTLKNHRKKNTIKRKAHQISESKPSTSTSFSCFRLLLRVREVVALGLKVSPDILSLALSFNLAFAIDVAFSFPSASLFFVPFSFTFVDVSPEALNRVVARLGRALVRGLGEGEGEGCLWRRSSSSSSSNCSSCSIISSPTTSSSSEAFLDQFAATALGPLPRFCVTLGFGFDLDLGFGEGETSRSGSCTCSNPRLDLLLPPALFFRIGLTGTAEGPASLSLCDARVRFPAFFIGEVMM
ncbi:hypothetical protein J3R30DRAFT_3417354 [Lentinula aciculospora]|uniref:Uncharacterized protein n=1 Tax=Lentinula aciculospora TaxID=153920 RepID=A0A9W9DXN4_9AGAR|nr:hypothetical protein J3R30DRAFT_3417354 [Lentinula aciculospora]